MSKAGVGTCLPLLFLLAAGAKGYDVMVPTGNTVEALIKLNDLPGNGTGASLIAFGTALTLLVLAGVVLVFALNLLGVFELAPPSHGTGSPVATMRSTTTVRISRSRGSRSSGRHRKGIPEFVH